MLSRGGRLTTSGLRITSIKTIKPPDPELVKKQEEEKLRAQLQKEIVSRSRTCDFDGYECVMPVLAGRHYCRLHILQDPSAPYKQCSHTSKGGLRCQNPAPADSNDPTRDMGLCYGHAQQSFLARIRKSAPAPPVTTSETLLTRLQHYVKPDRPRTTSCASSVSVVSDPSDQDQISPLAVDPFKQMDATAVNASYSASILECASEGESDCEVVTLGRGGNCRGGFDEELSESEDAPCERAPLWRAGVYTAEEAIRESEWTLRTLQTAYVKQMDRLRTLLHTARLQYIRNVKAEKEHHCNINSQARTGPLTVRERKQLRKLKAYASYHKKHGVDAVLARKLHHKRAKANEWCVARSVPAPCRCSFSEGGVRCPSQVLPAAKHCLKHILQDAQQVLFTACGDSRGLFNCKEVVAKLPLPSNKCRYHTDPPQYTIFTLKKDDSDSETESISTSDESRENVTDIYTDERTDSIPDSFTHPMEVQYE